MNKTIKIIIIIVLSVWIFAMGFEIGSFRETKRAASTTTAPAAQTTLYAQTVTPESTQAQATATQIVVISDTVTTVSATGNAATTAAPAGTDQNNAAMLLALASAVNGTRNYNGTVKAVGHQVKDIELTKCSVDNMTSTVNRIVQTFIGDGDDFNYTFVNGVESSDSSVTAKSAIPPRAADFALTEAGITSISSTTEGTDTVYTAVIKSETANLSSPPVHHSVSSGYLDLSGLSILQSIDYEYGETQLTVKVNPEGLMTSLHLVMPIKATGVGKVLGMEGSATFEGSLDETWTFTY